MGITHNEKSCNLACLPWCLFSLCHRAFWESFSIGLIVDFRTEIPPNLPTVMIDDKHHFWDLQLKVASLTLRHQHTSTYVAFHLVGATKHRGNMWQWGCLQRRQSRATRFRTEICVNNHPRVILLQPRSLFYIFHGFLSLNKSICFCPTNNALIRKEPSDQGSGVKTPLWELAQSRPPQNSFFWKWFCIVLGFPPGLIVYQFCNKIELLTRCIKHVLRTKLCSRDFWTDLKLAFASLALRHQLCDISATCAFRLCKDRTSELATKEGCNALPNSPRRRGSWKRNWKLEDIFRQSVSFWNEGII